MLVFDLLAALHMFACFTCLLLQVHAAAGAAGPGHPARRVERQPDGARLHDEQHDQRAGSRVVCVVCFFPPTAAAGASLVSSSLPSRQVLPLLSPCATASPLVESLVEPQVCALFQVQHNGQRRRQRAAAARRYTLLLQAFRPGHSLPPPKSNAIPALYCAGAGVPRNKRLLEAGCGCTRHYPLHATAGQRLT